MCATFGDQPCFLCYVGMYCDQQGLSQPSGECHGGYFCEEGSHVPDLKLCSVGHFCPNGTEFQIPCPIGTFNGEDTKRERQTDKWRRGIISHHLSAMPFGPSSSWFPINSTLCSFCLFHMIRCASYQFYHW